MKLEKGHLSTSREVQLPTTLLDCKDVVMMWKAAGGGVKPYTSNEAWASLRPSADRVAWFHLVWPKDRIPKHAFTLWLAIRNGLATQEKLILWKQVPPDTCCSFCKAGIV